MAEAVLEAPETEETSPAEPELALTQDDKDACLALLRSCMKEEQYSRRSEVRWARLQRYYERGDQNIGYDERSYSFIPLADYARQNNQEMPKYAQVYNIYRARLRSLSTILSQVSPGINFKPKSLKKSTDISAAQFAEKMRHAFDREVIIKERQGEATRLFCTDSRVILWTRNDEGKQKCSTHGVLESKVPIHLKSFEKWGYCVLSDEVDKYQAQDEYPDLADQLDAESSATAESAYERIARIGVLGGTRSLTNEDGMKNLITSHNAWFRPARYRKLPEKNRAKISKMFPNGMYLRVIGEVVCKIEEGIMDDCLAVDYPVQGDGSNRPSLLKDYVACQDTFNDTLNMRKEGIDYGIPGTWFDSDSVDEEAIAEQRSEPGARYPIKVKNGSSVQNLVMQEDPAVIPPDAAVMGEMMSGALGDLITGDLPTLQGGELPSNDTFGAYSMSREQAMGQLSTPWAAIQRLFARATYQGVIQMAIALGDEQVTVEDDKGGADSFAASEVLAGEFGAYPDQDSSFPETTASKRSALQATLTALAGTPLGEAIESSPDNAELILSLTGLEDFVIPQATSRNKQLEEIEQLLAEQPIEQTGPDGMPVIDTATGQPQLTCSVDIDADCDFHDWEWAKVQEWLSSPPKRQQMRKGNILGVQNVRLHGLKHKAIIDQKAQAGAQAANPQKPPSVSIAYKDLDPDGKVQAAAEAGIKVSADAIQEQQGMTDAKDALPHVLAHEKAAQQVSTPFNGGK